VKNRKKLKVTEEMRHAVSIMEDELLLGLWPTEQDRRDERMALRRKLNGDTR
jgi:hypothetical protein